MMGKLLYVQHSVEHLQVFLCLVFSDLRKLSNKDGNSKNNVDMIVYGRFKWEFCRRIKK